MDPINLPGKMEENKIIPTIQLTIILDQRLYSDSFLVSALFTF